jgi:hypothetical protein
LDKIQKSIATEGYRYAIYRRGLARALFATGDVEAAKAMAAEAREERDAGSIRLDLERERALAQQLEIRLSLEAGDTSRADRLIGTYERRWGRAELADLRADPDASPDIRSE